MIPIRQTGWLSSFHALNVLWAFPIRNYLTYIPRMCSTKILKYELTQYLYKKAEKVNEWTSMINMI